MQSTGQPAKVAVPSEDGEKRYRTDLEASFFYLMPTRGAKEDTFKRRQKYGGGNNSKFGHATKVNGTLGRDMETIVERRPNEEGLFGFTEDCGLSHLDPLPNTHALNNCMEVG